MRVVGEMLDLEEKTADEGVIEVAHRRWTGRRVSAAVIVTSATPNERSRPTLQARLRRSRPRPFEVRDAADAERSMERLDIGRVPCFVDPCRQPE
jgi:hypothetical protein